MAEHSITHFLELLRSGSDSQAQKAAQAVWDRYSRQLLELARRHLESRARVREDEEDVLQDAYKSFVIRLQRGEYTIEDRFDLWRLLVRMTENKARNVIAKHRKLKRDYRREVLTKARDGGQSAPTVLELAQAIEPTPDDAAILAEEAARRLAMLPEDLRRLALRKLEGFTEQELAGAKMMDCSVRTVERKLRRIRAIWEAADAAEM